MEHEAMTSPTVEELNEPSVPQPDAETYSTDGPECPHCHHVQNVSDDPSIYYDEELAEVECDSCDRTFSCSVHIRHSWTSWPKEKQS